MSRTSHLIRAILAVLILCAGLPCIALDSETPSLAPENSAFLDYINSGGYSSQMAAPTGTEYPAGLIPEPIDLSHLDEAPAVARALAGAFPATYDLRLLGKLTPVRNQGGCGSCWAFASYGSLESSIMPGESLDLSENNLKNLHGFDISCCSGGNRTMSTAYLARWAGAVSESDDPYNTGSCYSPTLAPRKHVQDVVYIPNRTNSLDNDGIKQAVMTYGALYTSYYHSDSYYRSATRAYYFGTTGQANHGVCVVGWDDNFSRSNFLTTPPGDGAFIVRNSWGTYWGQSGYFYVSYYDTLFGRENGAFLAESNTNYDTIYQYDPLGWITSTGYGSNTAWFANVFTATSNGKIAAASWYSSSPGSTYELRVYVSPTSGPISASGPATTQTGTISTVGYHTVKIASPVAVATGQKFSVVVKLTTPGYSYPIALERAYSGYASAARANVGESFMSSSGSTWTDVAASYSNTNVCLKAFATSGTTPGSGNLVVTPSTGLTSTGEVGGPFSPTSQSYTLTNSGTAALSWTAGANASWASVSSAGGTLDPGASTTVTVSLNSAANALAVGSYSGTTTFTNATNGNGTTTRTIALNVTAPGSGSLSVTPSTGLNSTGQVGGPFSPTSQSYTLTNSGTASLNWTSGVSAAWASVSAAGGTLNAGASATVTVSLNSAANALAVGSYSGTTTFTNTTNGNGSTTRPISLTVTQTPPPPPPASGYRIEPTTYSWVDPTNHPRVSVSDNSSTYALTMPFNFSYYGNTYNRIYIGSNGLVGFASSMMYSYSNTQIPNSLAPNAAIYPYWDDLNPLAGGSVRVAGMGTAPNRRVVISWVGVPHKYSPATKLTFQAILYEGTNDIVFQYMTVGASGAYSRGASATIGIENATGTAACMHSYNTAGAVSDRSALKITTNYIQTRSGRKIR